VDGGGRVRRGSYSLRSYALRRILRLVPAYYVAIVVVLLLWPTPKSFLDVLSHLFFLHGLTPGFARTMSPAFWSLTPEVVFYLLLPLIILKLTKLWHRVVLFVVLLAVSFPTQILASQSVGARHEFVYGEMNPFQFYSSFPTTLLYLFLAGVLLRMLVEHLSGRPAPRWQAPVAFILFVVSSSYTILRPGLGFLHMSILGKTGNMILSFTIRDLVLFFFFASAVLGAPVLRRLLRWKPLSFVGLVSYSMFVFHQTVLMLISTNVLNRESVQDFIKGSTLTMWGSFGAYILFVFTVVLIISYLGYRYIESPFLRIKPK